MESTVDAKINCVVAIPDDEYNKLLDAVKKSKSKGFYCKDKNDVEHIFYFENKTLKARKCVNEKWEDFEVMTMSEALEKQAEMRKHSPFKQTIKQKMKEDNPDWSEEKLDANADIITEANETIKRLIAKGVDAEMAHKMVTGVLYSDEVREHIVSELKQKLN